MEDIPQNLTVQLVNRNFPTMRQVQYIPFYSSYMWLEFCERECVEYGNGYGNFVIILSTIIWKHQVRHDKV